MLFGSPLFTRRAVIRRKTWKNEESVYRYRRVVMGFPLEITCLVPSQDTENSVKVAHDRLI